MLPITCLLLHCLPFSSIPFLDFPFLHFTFLYFFHFHSFPSLPLPFPSLPFYGLPLVSEHRKQQCGLTHVVGIPRWRTKLTFSTKLKMKRKKKENSTDISSKQHAKIKRFKSQPKKAKKSVFVQPKLPKSKEEISSNWIALQKVSAVGLSSSRFMIFMNSYV